MNPVAVGTTEPLIGRSPRFPSWPDCLPRDRPLLKCLFLQGLRDPILAFSYSLVYVPTGVGAVGLSRTKGAGAGLRFPGDGAPLDHDTHDPELAGGG